MTTNLESTNNKNVIDNKLANDLTKTEIGRDIYMLILPSGAKVDIVDVLPIACQAINAKSVSRTTAHFVISFDVSATSKGNRNKSAALVRMMRSVQCMVVTSAISSHPITS